MLTNKDLELLHQKGITEEKIGQQLKEFATGFPFLEIISPATPDQGVLQLEHEQISAYLERWDRYLQSDAIIMKFVPASGAASRMFKDLFEFLSGESEVPTRPAEIQFFDNITNFAFYKLLDQACRATSGKTITELLQEGAYKTIVATLLNADGLNYGALPKGLLQFHTYDTFTRTPFEEHLSEGALYAMNKQSEVNIHFTVSSEHRPLFQQHLAEVRPVYEESLGAKFNLGFSEQKPSTDTIAADEHNEPFREDGKLVFRPGGHGALIENLNDLDADIIFIKNIDNIVPDARKNPTVIYKKMLAGLLVSVQEKSFGYLREMDEGLLPDERLWEIAGFCEQELNNIHPGIAEIEGEALQEYLYAKLNRPIRVCGMVPNTGEPGGGPFLTVNADGTISPQILESSQIDLKNPVEKAKMMRSTHFNPVDLVCAVRNYKGEKYDLLRYVDHTTGFISLKSKGGKELKALELPGLWNGSMSDWNTLFVEVPLETFNPVKTVNDLLRQEHQF
ncbi:MAG: NAD metabolism ATPase/kinase [Paludibacter sp. 47-17]|nr:MAG: NAD metabolism ATPase/kinase [Paludibacter sp. 47-17]